VRCRRNGGRDNRAPAVPLDTGDAREDYATTLQQPHLVLVPALDFKLTGGGVGAL
jgi:hypothetical protein